VNNVDWPCEFKTLFRNTNVGCKRGPSLAITWFFENEESGIILEDDCVPHGSFFEYCTWALAAYRDDKRVWHINGNNFGAPTQLFGASAISFVPLAQVWGWATWRDRWCNFDVNPFYIAERAELSHRRWSLSRVARANKLRHIQILIKGLDTWDFQWQTVILDSGGLVMCPKANLVSNIGDGVDATHTPNDSRANLPVEEFVAVAKHEVPVLNRSLTTWYEKQMGLRKRMTALTYILGRYGSAIAQQTRRLLSRAIFGRSEQPVIVASSGRSGSTLLCDAIAQSLVRERFGHKVPKFISHRLRSSAIAFKPRLSLTESGDFPVLKTHDLPPTRLPGKCIFIFGNPGDAVRSASRLVSAAGEIWLQEHLYNLCSHGDLSELFQKDILNYEEQITAWTNVKVDNILIVCYEDLWDRVDEITTFIGMKLTLPKKRERASSGMISGDALEGLHHLQELYERERQTVSSKPRLGSLAR